MADNTYISLYGKSGKIHIFKDTIRAIGQPRFVRFRINPDGRLLLEPYNRITLTSFRVPKNLDDIDAQMEVSTTALIRVIYREFGFNPSKSYRINGVVYESHQVAVFDISTATPITGENR